MCALEAGKRGRRVLLVEHNERVGRKIRISGGGRCNFTNIHAAPDRYLSNNPRFPHSAMARYTPDDFVAYIESHQIAYHEKTLGQLFCDGSAEQVIDALVNDCIAAGVEIRTGCRVDSVEKTDIFSVATAQGTLTAKTLVVATGGLSIPKLGATDIGYWLAEKFGLPLISETPGLVPLTLPDDVLHGLADLSGISFDAVVSIGKTRFEEAVLITHRGLSGPAILQISSYWEPGQTITLNMFPEEDLEGDLLYTKRAKPMTLPRALLTQRLSNRFVQRLCKHNGWETPLGEMTDKQVRAIARGVQQWQIPIAGTEGYAKAEVTRGGVDTRALSPKTMEARDVPGLYFIGEVVDVTGWLGGYNFQWAWASAAAAGRAL